MERNHLPMTPIVLAALLLAGCSSKADPIPAVPEGAEAWDLLVLGPCTYKAGETEYSADCGTLVVPENRSDPGSRLIVLPVIRVRALGESPSEPIFRLEGGPGSTNLEFQYLEGLVERHDFVQVGYRDVDGSMLLDCPEIAEAVRKATGGLLGDAASLPCAKTLSYQSLM